MKHAQAVSSCQQAQVSIEINSNRKKVNIEYVHHGSLALAIAFCFISFMPSSSFAQGQRTDARQAKAIFGLLDTNQDKTISMAEFKNNQMLIFYVWDKNKDLVLSSDETPLQPDGFMRISGEDRKIDTIEFMNVVDPAFEQADINRDGVLSFDEFTKMRQLVRRK